MKPYPEVPEGLLVTHDKSVLRVQLNRPERRNALTDDIVVALIDTLDAAGGDEAIRVIELSGAGEHFCSGFDLGERTPAGPEKPRTGSLQRRMHWHVNRLIPTMLETQTPIVAVARGWVIGLGLNLVLASDFAIVASDARLWAPFTDFGFTADSGASWLLPRLAGVARAKEMLLLGRKVRGQDAADWGMVHQAAAPDMVDAAATALVAELAAAPTVAVGLSKLLIQRGLERDLHAHLADEALALELSSRSEDFAEYRRAQRDKRNPNFRGR